MLTKNKMDYSISRPDEEEMKKAIAELDIDAACTIINQEFDKLRAEKCYSRHDCR
jgi:hypothetical protein